MPRITPYQQGQLASSLTGTPGQYNGVAAPLGQIAQSANHLENIVYGINKALFDDALQQRREKEAELKAYDRKLKEAEQDAYLAEKTSRIDRSLTDLTTSLQMNNMYDTENAAREFQAQSKQIFDAEIEQEKDPLLKAKVQEIVARKSSQYQDTMLKWSQNRQVPIMESRIGEASNNFINSVANAALSAGEVGAKFHEYEQQNSGLYSFVKGPEGKAKMRDDLEQGVMQYLHATALNAPELLEPRIKAFSGGTFIDPSKLNKFAIEERRIANEIHATQLAEEKKQNLAGQLEASHQIIESSPTGDWRDADPKVIEQVRRKFDPHLTNIQKIQFEQLQKQAAQEKIKAAKKQAGDLEKGRALVEEQTIVRDFSKYAADEGALAGKIDSQIQQLYKKGVPLEQKVQMLGKLQLDIDRYQESYASLRAVQGSITNKSVRDLANLHVIQAKERFGSIVGKLSNTPQAKQAREAKDTLYSKAYPPSMFTDAKKQGLFNYFYQSYFYDQISKMPPENISKAANSARYTAALQRTLKEKAYRKMVELGVGVK